MSGGDSNAVAATWYASWHSSDFTLQDVSWPKYSNVIYAFATTTPDVNVLGLEDSDKELLPQFVQAAHENSVKAIPPMQTGRPFAQAVMKLVSTYNLDGVSFDWEYPNKQGIGCNIISTDDSANFLSFLQTLRSQDRCTELDHLCCGSPSNHLLVPDGNPMTDVSEFAKVLNYIEVMNYDVWGSWSNMNQEGSAVSAVKAWSTAGFPANQIILGVASYGHSFHVNKSSALDASGNIQLYAPFDKSQQPAGDKWDDTADGVDCDGTVANGIEYVFDNCSKTPYVYNSTSQVMVSFDDAASFTAKGHYIKDAGLAGFALWQTGGDSEDILLDAIKLAIDCSD
ncbi:glycoside hydrolase [Lactarius sanguifluus]|nr:glycoside hydrolase [Lactarius sanguifluus]